MNTNIFKQPFYSQASNPNTQSFQTKKRNTVIVSIALLLSLSGCTTMSSRDKNTAIGAVTGAVLTGGSAWGTVGGATVGGVIGSQIGR